MSTAVARIGISKGPEKGLDLIFVHASPRSGSTYFFNVLRRNRDLLCFNETIIDGKHDLARFRNRNRTTAVNRVALWDLNHDFLDREDFDEFLEAWDSVMYLCPKFPAFVDYLPANGRLSIELTTYLSAIIGYAQLRGKRPVLCEINSRGRAGALRGAFGGFHIAQYRDPFSQFGSFIRAVIEGGFWGFLAFPATELGTSGTHPLYHLIPEHWRAPQMGWRAKRRSQHWASDAQYFATVGLPENLERAFRWHMFSWVLTNLAAISYSEVAIDIDKAHDKMNYRAEIIDNLNRQFGVTIDLSDIRKFDRYYNFESLDVSSICDQVVSAVRAAKNNGQLAQAIGSLGTQLPVTPIEIGVPLLLDKIRDSFHSMESSTRRRNISTEEWESIARHNRKIWFNPKIRRLAEYAYPIAAPVVRAARWARVSRKRLSRQDLAKASN